MDKRGVRVLLGCLMCFLLIIILFFVALQFLQPSCELILIEKAQLAKSQADFLREDLIKSSDKSLLLKISAHLNYTLESDYSNIAPGSLSISNSLGLQRPANHTAIINGVTVPVSGQLIDQASHGSVSSQPINEPINVPTAHAAGSLRQPQLWQTNWTSSSDLASANSSMTNSTSKLVYQLNREKRYLPLELDSISSKRLDEQRVRYSLSFNCSTLIIDMVQRPDRIYVERMSMDLKVPSRKKTNCELQIPERGMFGVDADNGAAHCFNDRPLVFKCLYRTPKNLDIVGTKLAELHINRIEFETVPTKNKDRFSIVKKECEVNIVPS